MTAEEIAIKHGLYHSHTKQADDKAVAAINEHTAAHTAALRERVKELEGILNQVVYEYEQGEQSFKTILEIKEVLKNG